ncbi:MAG: AAA family ATPase [Ruminococcus sp.]|nr:AAA family ATPase [Ruminococcus sp.]
MLSYQEWINVGMALKDAGFPCSVWDMWSMNDTRYRVGECEKKWETFKGSSGRDVTIATVMQMAFDGGFRAEKESYAFDWDDEIGGHDDYVIIDRDWIESKEIHPPKVFDPVKEITTYLETLFDGDETIGYVTETWEKDGKFMPTKGSYKQTAGELISGLAKCGGDIGNVIGDYNAEAGAWIRINPLDGNGVKNENVTEFRYALVESDVMEIDKQNAVIRELELPVAALVYSGGKSLHAIVRIDAADYNEYRKRVDYLYNVCAKNGLEIDRQNKNPSRLSRLPGVVRGDKKQFIVDTNIGKQSFTEWKEWIESVNDDLPDPESLEANWENLPPLAPCLIDGVLRQGHKMLVAGPSKAGKSYALIELCIAIAEGKNWLGFGCAQGKVLYVNLELDSASCLHRFKDVYTALKFEANNLKNIDIWNLRGRSIPMDKLAPKLIRRAYKKDYTAIVIDPIYKVITGDENSADQMAAFCNQFDKVCTELGCAVIYCHHHSKGAQGGKRSMDRASGSGVFARDPDALLDLIELKVPDSLTEQEQSEATCKICVKWLSRFFGDSWHDDVSQDDLCISKAMLEYSQRKLPSTAYQNLIAEVKEAEKRQTAKTAWRIEGTLREFPKFPPLNLWFDYPVHKIDDSGKLKDIQADSDNGNSWKRNFSQKKTNEERSSERKESILTAYEACSVDGQVTLSDLAEYTGKSIKTVKRHVKEHGGFWIDGNEVGLKDKDKLE